MRRAPTRIHVPHRKALVAPTRAPLPPRKPAHSSRSRAGAAPGASAGQDLHTSDVVIVGAGIVGLCTARELLRHGLSVTLVERGGLCAGATGAGQGYLWMAHRSPGSAGWALAARSVAAWRLEGGKDEGLRGAVEWQDCGSLLLARTPSEAAGLGERQLALNAVGLRATYMDPRRLSEAEPALSLPSDGGALRVASDAQINGRAAAAALLERCRAHPAFTDHLHSAADGVELEEAGAGGAGHVVRAAGRRLAARHAVVLAAGVWSGAMLAAATGNAGWAGLLAPRRGHLLELPAPGGMPRLAAGMMEVSYTKHYASSTPASAGAAAAAAAGSSQPDTETDITFTATTSVCGSLLIGSSRELGQWDTAPSPPIVASILRRAALFLPDLQPAAAEAAAVAAAGASTSIMTNGGGGAADMSIGGGAPLHGMTVRVGLRPYAVGGLPLVGPVEGVPGLFVAAGHEGSGLAMGPATADLIARHIRKHTGAAAGGAAAAGAGPAAAAAAAAAAAGGDCLDTASFRELLPDVRLRAAMASGGKA